MYLFLAGCISEDPKNEAKAQLLVAQAANFVSAKVK